MASSIPESLESWPRSTSCLLVVSPIHSAPSHVPLSWNTQGLCSCGSPGPSAWNAFPPDSDMAHSHLFCPTVTCSEEESLHTGHRLSHSIPFGVLSLPLPCWIFLHSTYQGLTNVYASVPLLLPSSHQAAQRGGSDSLISAGSRAPQQCLAQCR